ncbi:MAG: SH3 domain-containing protein [Candidatus Viridilinea halotolerans]|uniref:SH3 domain-containing protein n=1 Tax=Candidatus Viridilinea halotolerans TaxID=2491704 RepID=A0A426U8G5_9CHLR|nr:MAG: SH3 domain-containing protein [Candidatus Viridilinea halotolerans]
MTQQPPEESIPGPLELLEAARRKYTLAMARARYGPPELALLSLHGCLEDALRSHGMRLGLAAAFEPFPQLLDALVTAPHMPLSVVEAEGVRRMHRLRAYVAHGEQMNVAASTISAYHQLVARLLPRYGVTVVAPEPTVDEEGLGQEAATATTTRMRRPAPEEERGERRSTGRQRRETGPRRERTVYPDDQPARYMLRGSMPSAATRDLPLAREMLRGQQRRDMGALDRAERLAEFWERSQRWLLPAIVLLSLLLIGAVISLSLKQMRTPAMVPTASLQGTPNIPALVVPTPLVGDPAESLSIPTAPEAATTPEPGLAPTEELPGGLAVGQTAYVVPQISPGLNLRERPSAAFDSPILVALGPSTAVEIIGGPVQAEGLEWWQVRAGGSEGWCAGQFLELRR